MQKEREKNIFLNIDLLPLKEDSTCIIKKVKKICISEGKLEEISE